MAIAYENELRHPEAAGARREEIASLREFITQRREEVLRVTAFNQWKMGYSKALDDIDTILALPAPFAPPPHSQASEVVEAVRAVFSYWGVGNRSFPDTMIKQIIAAALSRQAPQPADAEAKYKDALEQIALLDEADGHELTVKQAFEAIAIATSTLGKHPSEIHAARYAAPSAQEKAKADIADHGDTK